MKLVLAGGVYRKSADELTSQQPTPEMVLTAALRERGVSVRNLPLEALGDLTRPSGCDVVHVHHLSKASVVAGALRPRIPYVFSRHGTGEPPSSRERLGLAVTLRRAWASVALSEVEAEQISVERPWMRPRVRVIPNGLDLGAFTNVKRAEPSQELICLFVGQLISLKRVHLLIRLIASVPGTRLRLVYHNASLEADLRALARQLGVDSRVEFLGPRRGQALVQEYANAHVLMLPSTTEALPSVVTEGIATGLPVIASDVGGVREQVSQAGILVNPSDPGALVEALIELRANYPVYAEHASRQSAAVRSQYSIDAMAETHIALYKELLEGKSR